MLRELSNIKINSFWGPIHMDI